MYYDYSKRKYTIIVDTREKKPIIFPECVKTIKKALNPGDYSVLGYEKKIAIERKSADDYISCIINFTRLANQLQRLKNIDYKMLLITASYFEVMNKLEEEYYFENEMSFKRFNCILHYAERLGVNVCFIEESLISDFIINTFDYWLKCLKEKEKDNNKQCKETDYIFFFKGK